MNNGKQQLNAWGIIPLLGLICLFFYFVLPSPWAQSAFGCVQASVTIGGRTWLDPNTPNYTNPPPIEISCGSVEAFAGAGINTPCINYPTGGSVPGTPSFATEGEGFKVTTITNGYGWAKYLIEVVDPDKVDSKVTVTATVTGLVQTGYEEDGITPKCEEKTFTATGVVVLKPDCGCGGAGEFGNGSSTNKSVDLRLNLGPASPTASAGLLWLKADAPSVALATPASLQLPYRQSAEEVITNQTTGVIEQILVPQGLVHVKTVNAYEFQLQFFYRTNVTSKVNGHYGTNASAFVIWTVSNPDTTTAFNRLWITEQRGGSSRQQKFTYTTTYSRWDLLQPDGHTISTWKVPDGSNVDITNYFREISVGGTSLTKIQEVREYVSAINRTLLKQLIEGGDGVTRITTNAYYTSGVNAHELQRVDYPDGQWVYYVYDSAGRKVKEYSTYLNYPPPASGEPAIANGDRYKLTEYVYTINSSDEAYVNQIVRTTVSLPFQNGANWEMKEVSRNYRLTSASLSEVQQCVEPGADWDDPRNLKTQTASYGGTDYLGGKPSLITRPDGTSITYEYPDEFTTYETHSDGSFVEKVVDEWGKPLWHARTENGVLVSSETYCYTNSAGEYFDNLRRTYHVTDLAGRTNYYYYGCCSLESTVNPDGITTLFDYDSLKRSVASTVYYGSQGIKTTNVLDAVGQVLATKRIGTSGASITLEQLQYDILGRTIRHTNALNGVTTNLYAIVNDRLLEITLNPDGGTRTNTYYRDGNLESITGTAVSGVKYVYGVEEDGGVWRQYTKEIQLDANYAETSEWTKTYQDGAGRTYKTVYAAASAPYPYRQSWYNNQGQLWKERDPDGVWTLYKHNSYSELDHKYTVSPLTPPNSIYGVSSYEDVEYDTFYPDYHFYTADRISKVANSVVFAAGSLPDLRRTETHVWKDGESVSTILSTSETSTDRLRGWQTTYGGDSILVVAQFQTVYGANGNRWVTNTAPAGNYSVSHYLYGRLQSVIQRDTTHGQVGRTDYEYDAHGRHWKTTDARTGTTTYTYNDADRMVSVTTPNPDTPGSAPQITTTHYNKMLQATNVVQPDGTSVFSEFFPSGLLKKTCGSRNYPVEYTYDYAGRMKTMKTWQDFAGNAGTAITTWNYDAYRGWLVSKDYPDATTGAAGTVGPDYTYTDAGRLRTRTWARTGTGGQRILTTYGYGFDGSGDKHGDLAEVVYSYDPVSTPAVTYTYDRLGRQKTALQNGITTTLAYNDAGRLLSEAFTGGILNSLSLTNGYDEFLRRTNLAVLNSTTRFVHQAYAYDDASRLDTVTDRTTGTPHSAQYTYLANSPMVNTVTFKQNTTTRMTTTRQFDKLNRLLAITSTPGGSGQTPISYAHTYNSANQRTRATLADGSYWRYEYDALGQVKSGRRYFSDGTPVPGQQFEYGHDDIGNRISTAAGGDENGWNLRTADYTRNRLNQYSQRTVPGYVDTKGIALATAGVTVNSLTPYRKGEYFWKELSVANSSAPVWQSVAIAATGETTVNRNAFVPQTPEAFSYDADGNMTGDGRWVLTWDAENRLIKAESYSGAPTASKRKVEWTYDYKSRRVRQTTSTGASGSYVVTEDLKFLSDPASVGRHVAELNYSDNALRRSYVWGLDLSGSLDGAGGVGGLLMVNSAANGVHFCAYDGNGNVAGLVKGTDGNVSAVYEYDPFGQTLRATGPMADENRFQFSTKRADSITSYVLYEYRAYQPNTGRWLSRDPLEEEDFRQTVLWLDFYSVDNQYNFLENDGLNSIDLLGLIDPNKIREMREQERRRPQNCVKSGGTWATYAEMYYGGNVNACVGDLTGCWNSWPGRLANNIWTCTVTYLGGYYVCKAVGISAASEGAAVGGVLGGAVIATFDILPAISRAEARRACNTKACFMPEPPRKKRNARGQ